MFQRLYSLYSFISASCSFGFEVTIPNVFARFLVFHRFLIEAGPWLPFPGPSGGVPTIALPLLVIVAPSAGPENCFSGERRPRWQKPCEREQIFAHGLYGYVGASARAAPLRSATDTSICLRGTFLVVQPVHLHRNTRAALALKSANMVSANVVSVLLIPCSQKVPSCYQKSVDWDSSLQPWLTMLQSAAEDLLLCLIPQRVCCPMALCHASATREAGVIRICSLES